MRLFNLALLTFIAVGLCSCGQPVRYEKLTQGYVLFAADRPEDLHICYSTEGSCIGGIESTIARVGWDDRYIVAESHPDNDTTRSRFFYIDLTVKDSAMSGVSPPLTSAEFQEASHRLGLPPLSHRIEAHYALGK